MSEKTSWPGGNFSMSREAILDNLKLLNDELSCLDIRGEIALVGGAVMCLVFKTRESTHDIDAIFEPKQLLYDCIKRVAEKMNMPSNWINDSVKGFLSTKADFVPHLELSNLSIMVASPEYLLAMKCLSSRVDHPTELGDIQTLITHLGLTTYDEVEEVILKYYPANRFHVKTKYVIKEILGDVFDA